MKQFIRCACFAFAMVMLLSVPAFAAENAEPKASSFFTSSSVYLGNVSGTSFTACFDVTGTGTMDAIGANFIKIQRSSDGVNWTTVLTCSKDNYLYFVDYNSTAHSASVRVNVTGGYYYRAYIQLYAKNSSGTGVRDRYTSAIYIPAN